MPYKLYYFDARGRGEVCRQIFALGGVKYEDIRLSSEEWQKIKPDSPFGLMPILETDDLKISGSNAMARYLANKFGFAGKTPEDKAKVDMAVDCVEDFLQPMMKAYFASEDQKEELMKKWVEEQRPSFLTRFEKLLSKNKNGDGFFVGDGITWADVSFNHVMSWNTDLDLTPYPKVAALVKRVNEYPAIKEWIAKRPVTKN